MWKKSIAALVLTGAVVLGSTMNVSACMGIYVGKEVSETGSSYIGRSEDIGNNYTKIYTVHPAEDHEPGEMFTDSYGFSMEYPAHTYRYTLAKDSPLQGEGDEAFAEVGINENEVAVTATVSTYYNEEAKAADPLVSNGICEISMGTILLGQAKSARHGVELLGDIIDKYGTGECNIIMISDPNETWYMETVSGHEYAAVKLPDDKVAAIPNMMLLGTIDVNDKENVIVSDGLVSLAEENGFLKTENGMIHVAKTYGAKDPGRGQLTRLWQGVYYLNAEKADEISIEPNKDGSFGPYDLLFAPSKKLSSQDIMKFLAFRGEGTKFDSNKDAGIYPIGNSNQAECHVLEMREGMYDGMSGIEWIAMSRAEYSLYLPYYAAMITETWEGYHNEEMTSVPGSMYWLFCDLNNLADDNRDLYGKNVRTYLDKYQSALIEQQDQVDKDMAKLYEKSPVLAQEKATELGKLIAKETYEHVDSIRTELKAFIAEGKTGEFMPSVLEKNVMPNYSVERVMEPVDKTVLEKMLGEVKELLSQIDAAAYTEESYNALKSAAAEAEELLADITADQTQIDEMVEKLKNAKENLTKLAVQKPDNEEKTDSTKKPTVSVSKKPTKSVKTGDETDVSWMLAMAAAGVSALAMSKKRR